MTATESSRAIWRPSQREDQGLGSHRAPTWGSEPVTVVTVTEPPRPFSSRETQEPRACGCSSAETWPCLLSLGGGLCVAHHGTQWRACWECRTPSQTGAVPPTAVRLNAVPLFAALLTAGMRAFLDLEEGEAFLCCQGNLFQTRCFSTFPMGCFP